MTTEQPTRPARPPRPGPAFRRAALGLPPASGPAGHDAAVPTSARSAPPAAADDGATRGGGAESEAPRRESLRDALARIPDLEHDPGEAAGRGGASAVGAAAAAAGVAGAGAGAGAAGMAEASGGDQDDRPVAGPVPSDGRGIRAIASRLLNGQVPADAELTEVPTTDPPSEASADDVPKSSVDDLFVPIDPVRTAAADAGDASAGLSPDAPEWLVAAAEVEQQAVARSNRHRPPAPPTWRRVGFAAVVLLLIGAIPALGNVGYQLVTESTDGRFTSNVKSPTDPGFETEVVSTPTQILLHNDAEGRPVAATVLSLSGAEGGGAVIFVPLNTEVRTPAFGVDKIIRAFDVLSERPPDGRKQVAVQVASLLNVGIDGVVEVDDRGWAQLVAPVAPLAITNPDPIEIDGEQIPSGPIELSADQIGPYLAATRDGEPAFNALVRHELVWEAWLAAIAESTREDVVPGESSSGIGLFARSLADGPVTYSVVPTTPDPDDPTRLRLNGPALGEIVLAAVPSPDPATPGSRATVRLLNGVSAEAIPAGIIQTVVRIGGSVQVIGNGPSFGRDETTIVYSNPVNRGYAELLQVAMGGGTVRHDPEAQDSVALTVILGRDVIEGASVTTTTADIDTSDGPAGGFSSDDDTPIGSTDSDTDFNPEVPE